MSISGNLLRKILSIVLVIAILLTTVGCSGSPPNPVLSDPNGETLVEKTQTENVITENTLTEFITSEIYLEEFILAENKVTELLLEEEMINEVILCKTIYIPQDHINEFAEHSQTAQLFGEGFQIKSVLNKVAIGTGVILTIAIVEKAGLPQPIASIVAAAADESLKFAASGAVVGTVFGAFTGAADEIDESGRISAVAAFALATVGVIVTGISLVGAIPSGGTSGWGVAEGIHLAWTGVKFILAASGAVVAARDTVKAFTSTPVSEIDWDNVNWDQLGVATAQKAIQYGADGYMWGSIFGAIDGGVESYYQKFCTPYTQYQNRLKQTPVEGKKGHWSGDRGESDFILDEPIKLSDGTVITKITYQNAVPDFSPYALAEVKIPNMTDLRYGTGGNFEQADTALAELWTKMKYQNRTWTAADVEAFRTDYPYKLTWHEMSNMESMQLVPFDVNNTFTHYGGVAEYNAMIGQTGGSDFD
mgnify:FL=1